MRASFRITVDNVTDDQAIAIKKLIQAALKDVKDADVEVVLSSR